MRSAVLALLVPLLAAASDGVVVETAHYRIAAEATEDEAREMGSVLEAAWPRWKAYFGKEPALEEGARLGVSFAASRDGFERRLRADGITPPAAGGYYSPRTRTAYLWRQPTRQYTRSLLLHECTHQFHILATTRNRSPGAAWYVEGLAEFLCRHHWDGENLSLGVVPLVTLEDYHAAALETLRAEGFDLRALIEGTKFDRPVSCALLRYLSTADGGRLRGKLQKIRAKLDRGAGSAGLVFRTFGSPEKLRRDLVAFLEGEQEPFSQVFNSWEGLAPRSLHGWAPGAIVSVCRLKRPAARLGATLEVPGEGRWIGGLLLHYGGKGDYTVAMIHSGESVRVDRRRGDRWEIVARCPCPEPSKPGVFRLEAVRAKDGVRLRVGDVEVGTFDLPGETLGLALMGSDLVFRDLSWE